MAASDLPCSAEPLIYGHPASRALAKCPWAARRECVPGPRSWFMGAIAKQIYKQRATSGLDAAL